MKIVLFLPDLSTRGGVEQVTINLAKLFAGEAGYEVTILSCFSRNGLPAYGIPQGVKTAILGTSLYPSPALRRIAWYIALGAPLKKWLAENPSDVLIVQGGYLSAAVALSGLRKKPVLIGCDHLDPARMNPLHSIVSRITYPRLDALVVLTEAYRRYYSGWLQAVYCIPNFVDLEAAGCSNRDKKRLIACGRLTKQKGFDLLLHALVPVLTRYTDWEVVIYGAGPEKNALEALKVRLGLRAVSFPGETTDVPHKLAGASVFVMPSRYEGFPVALLEAMATGLPCVCFESPGTAAMIDDGTNGLLVPAEDTGAFSEALMRVMDDPETARRLGREASRKALLFSRPAVAERWKELFLLRPLLQKP